MSRESSAFFMFFDIRFQLILFIFRWMNVIKMTEKSIHSILDPAGFTPVAHRGASGAFPENTLESFAGAEAILPGCLLETDVLCTSDGVAVLRHDTLLETTTDGRGPVSHHPYTDIEKLDAGFGITYDKGVTYPFRGKGYRIATLEEALRMFPHSFFSIDIKDKKIESAERVTGVITGCSAEHRVIAGSFHESVTRYLREIHPDMARHAGALEVIRFLIRVKTGRLSGFNPRDHGFFVPEFYFGRSSEYSGVCSGVRIITEQFIRSAHEKGMPVYAWTINREDNMRRLIRWGINGIITDHPDLLKRVMSEESISFQRGILSW